tara:strand:- start:48 stop:233 length:186 start_codon:yes stop_codon:yes gene_type:complete
MEMEDAIRLTRKIMARVFCVFLFLAWLAALMANPLGAILVTVIFPPFLWCVFCFICNNIDD